ncbi:hypothetical protein H4219_004863 [Mycoemilia scoparia]|uniref:Short chain dehydrogenase n=1 Tax=Mycoemilia scoparia TaxID=417184 RepID=A0A9W8DKV1_9FUNG|nr:hypothetical protein H4219_004863 [Mycoemilia scoparia]
MSLKGKVAFITGGSRGIGLAIALKFAREGAKVSIASRNATMGLKSNELYEKFKGEGVEFMLVPCDVQSERQIKDAIEMTIRRFGKIDIVVNNTSQLVLKATEDINAEEYDRMFQINTRGTFMVAKLAIQYLKKSDNPHIVTLCPPISLQPAWFVNYPAYAVSKFSMSLGVYGLSSELKKYGIAVNALWPYTTINTDGLAECGNAEFQARPSGQFGVDELILRKAGVTDFDQYSTVSNTPLDKLSKDHFIPDDYEAEIQKLRSTAAQ